MRATLPDRLTQARLVEVAEGVHAYVQPDGGWCVNNAGVLAGEDGVVVIDTAATERRARQLASQIDRLGAGPGRVLVNTHHHGDHTFGNHLLRGDGPVIAHRNATREMAETGLALTGLWPDVEWGDVRVTPPTIEVHDRLTLNWSGRRAELIYVGPAHTNNDVVVWLPREQVLFAGDVLLSGCMPFVLMGSVIGSRRAVERLRELQPKIVVGGHGAIAGPDIIEDTATYLTWLTGLARAGHAAGLTPLELARAAELEHFAELRDRERLVANIHRAYQEIEVGGVDEQLAAPIDVAVIFGEMIEFNSGQLPACSA